MIERLEAVLDELGAADPQVLSDPEAVERLHRCLASLEAVTTRATAPSTPRGRGRRRAAVPPPPG